MDTAGSREPLGRADNVRLATPMTSTEFAAKYRLLKNVATRGARTFLAQQVALGRMVMVHYIDAEPDADRGDPVARLLALTGPARNKLLEILDVDGSPVAVTLFISSFADFSTWLDQVAPPAPATSDARVSSGGPEITAPRRPISRAPGAELRMQAPPLPEPTFGAPQSTPPTGSPSVEPTPTPASRGEFTQLFGKLDFDAELRSPATGTHTSPPAASAVPPDVPDFTGESATLIMEPPKPPVAEDRRVTPPPAPASAPVAPAPALPTPVSPAPTVRAEEPGDASFTAIFGTAPVKKAAEPFPVDPPRGLAPPLAAAPLPSFGAPPASERVMPFPAPPPERPVPVPTAPPPPAPAAGEFTQLFQRLNTAAPASPPTAPESVRPMDAMPLAGASSAPPAPSFAMQPPPAMPSAPPVGAIPPTFGAESPRAPNAAWGGATIPTEGGPSDYTRILGRISPLPEPNQPPVSKAPNATGPEAKPVPAVEPPRTAKSYLPLILALNAVALATVAIVLYFVFKK